jgi:hypothetical protein
MTMPAEIWMFIGLGVAAVVIATYIFFSED